MLVHPVPLIRAVRLECLILCDFDFRLVIEHRHVLHQLTLDIFDDPMALQTRLLRIGPLQLRVQQ